MTVAGKLKRLDPYYGYVNYKNKTVAFYFKPVGGSYGYIGSTTTNSYGNFAKSFTATRDGTWRAQFAGTSNFNRVLGSDYVDVY